MKKVFAALFLASAFFVGGCAAASSDDTKISDSASSKPESSQAAPQAESAVTEATKTIYEGDETLLKLGLSVTEGGIPTGRDAVYKRFAEYKEMGITCVRIDTLWDTSVKGQWLLSSVTQTMLAAAREYGLTMKLILPTIMAPPAWLSADENSRLEDYNGRLSVNTVSYWYDGIYGYTDMAVRAQLKALVDGGWSDVIGAVVVDMGPAGEGLYPPAWTQAANGLDSSNNGEEVMWCYADNAQNDFRAKMEAKYGGIASANAAWGTDFASFAALAVPRPGEASGQLWRNTLEWYRDTKRDFMAKQVDIFKSAMSDCGLGDRYLILYLPGADYLDSQWEACVSDGGAIAQIKLGGDNNYVVRLAAEKDCLLQYTGINDDYSLRLLRRYMYENGYGSIPVFGENAGDPVSAGDPERLAEIIAAQKLWGIDYTHSRMIYESDGVTHSALYDTFRSIIPGLDEYLRSVDISVTPELFASQTAAPDGDVLRLDISFDKPKSEKLAYIFFVIDKLNFTVDDGDTLEYDVRLSDDMQGLGAIDGSFSGGATMRDSFGMRDSLGISVHPNSDLSDYAYPDWYHRVIELGNASSDGASLHEIMLAAHPEDKDGAFTTADVTVWYDNIVIKRDGEVVLEIFRDDGDVTPPKSASIRQYATGAVTVESLG